MVYSTYLGMNNVYKNTNLERRTFEDAAKSRDDDTFDRLLSHCQIKTTNEIAQRLWKLKLNAPEYGIKYFLSEK